MNIPISEIMSTHLVTLGPNDPISEAVSIFKSHSFHHIPVESSRKLVGILSKTDILSLNDEQMRTLTTKEVMVKVVATLEPSDKIGTAVEVFLANRFHSIPVINDAHELLGIVTTFDVLKWTFEQAYPEHKAITLK